MATVQRKLKKKYTCSCGRSFAHAISLKRHKFVSGCVDDDDTESGEEQTQKVSAKKEEVEEAALAASVEEPADATRPLSIDEITHLYALANERLHPAPTTGMRLREMASHAGVFGREFGSWLAEESAGVGRWAGARVPAVLSAVGRGVLSLVTLAAVIAIFFAGLTMGITVKQAAATTEPYPAAPQPPVVGTTEATLSNAAAAVCEFYGAVNGGAYTAAYNRLSSGWRADIGYDAFVSGYAATTQVNCELTGARSLGERSARVGVRLAVVEGDRSVVYSGHYDLVHDGRSWQLDRGDLVRE